MNEKPVWIENWKGANTSVSMTCVFMRRETLQDTPSEVFARGYDAGIDPAKPMTVAQELFLMYLIAKHWEDHTNG